MGRKREVILDSDEDIVSYEHHISGKFVRLLIGYGLSNEDGSFTPSEGQNFESVVIQGLDYETLLAETDTKPAGVFRKEDLWDYVDIARVNFLADREKAKKIKGI